MRSVCLVAVLGLALAAAGCAPAATPSAPMPAGGALSITGAVAKPLSLSMDALRALPVVQLKAEHPKLGMQEYNGVRLNGLVDQAQPQASAANVQLVASDGFASEISLADLRKCNDCLLAFSADRIDAVMPGQASNTWVRGLVRIIVR